METMQLKDETVYPSDKVIQSALGEAFPVFNEFIASISSNAFGLAHEWRYYNDGKAWLCKVTHKKKTVIWVSVWSGFFKIAFYFTEKNGKGIQDLDINGTIKEQYESRKPIGKLKPIAIDVRSQTQLHDVFILIHYKKAIK